MRNLLATLILSQGTPMICAGDEFGTQPDAATTTPIARTTRQLDQLGPMDEESMSLMNFFRRLTSAFHLYPVLRRSRFLTGEVSPAIDVKDVRGLTPAAKR